MLRHSRMQRLGAPAPDFRLPDTAGQARSLAEFAAAPVLVVALICNHCPYVQRILPALAEFGRDCAKRGVAMVAISANDVDSHPEDAPPQMAEVAARYGFAFPYLYDAQQQVALAYEAICTPDFFVFDAQRRLAYRGRFDATRPNGAQSPDGADLRAAVEALLAGREPPAEQHPSMGCSIKWQPANEPAWA